MLSAYLLVRTSMQKKLQHMFKMSASQTRACIGTSLAYTSDVQRDRHKRCLLPRRAADAEVIVSH